MTITDHESAMEAARAYGAASGPLSEFASGRVPACFGRIIAYLAEQHAESVATQAVLDMPDDPDDAYWESGKEEMAGISRALRELLDWAKEQRCQPDACECRADRYLRRPLEENGAHAQTGVSRTRRRPSALIVGRYGPPDDAERRYVEVHCLHNIAHAVREHRGWRAVLVTATGVEPVYISPGYPKTPVSSYYDDTQACAAAIVAALNSRP